MYFELNGVKKSPGPFHTFDTFRQFRDWACRAFKLVRASHVAWFDKLARKWVTVPDIGAPFTFMSTTFALMSSEGDATLVQAGLLDFKVGLLGLTFYT